MSQLPVYLVLDPKLARLPRTALEKLQASRLVTMARYLYEETPLWRRKFDVVGLGPADIRGLEDLRRIPFCTKEELQKDQAANPPFGSYTASHSSRWVKQATTSGTTGVPLQRILSARDWGYILDRFQRNPTAGPGDTVVMLGPVDGLMGPMAICEYLARVGALVVHAGLSDARSKVRLLQSVRPTMVSGTPSFLLHMLEVAGEMGVELRKLGIRSIAAAGEPGGAVPATRQRLTKGWGASLHDGYGLTELFPLGGSCALSPALHIASDLVITEIVHPESGEPVPPGQPGEAVYTNLVGDTQALLRYRSRDIARLATDEACACGFTGTRLANSIEGRVDDMIWFRGVNVFPSAVEAVVRSFDELGDQYQIVVEGDRTLPTMTIRVEMASTASTSIDVQHRVREALRGTLRVRPDVELLPPGALPRIDAHRKSRRVVDRRRAEPVPGE
jgi:phenylacetate-CoA ligase